MGWWVIGVVSWLVDLFLFVSLLVGCLVIWPLLASGALDLGFRYTTVLRLHDFSINVPAIPCYCGNKSWEKTYEKEKIMLFENAFKKENLLLALWKLCNWRHRQGTVSNEDVASLDVTMDHRRLPRMEVVQPFLTAWRSWRHSQRSQQFPRIPCNLLRQLGDIAFRRAAKVCRA